MTKKELSWLTFGFIIWRLLIGLVMWLAPQFLPAEFSFPYQETLPTYQLPVALTATGNFDGVHYLTIIENGYAGADLVQAFFPSFPLLAKFTTFFTQNALFSLNLLATLFSYGLLLALFYWLKKTFSVKTARSTLLLIALFPTSFFLVCGYTESLFLLLLVLCFIFWQKKFWPALSLTLVLLTATRITGIIAVAAFFIYFLIDFIFFKKNKTYSWSQFWGPLLAIGLGSCGLLAYMIFLGVNYNDPFYFMTVQNQFGASRQTSSLVLLPQVIWRYLKIFISQWQTNQFWGDFKTFAYLQEFLLSCLFAIILLWQFILNRTWLPFYQKIKNSFWRHHLVRLSKNDSTPLYVTLFSGGAYLLPTLTGTFSSMPRYVLLCLSIFIWFGQTRHRFGKALWYLISTLLLVMNIILFTQGYWVA